MNYWKLSELEKCPECGNTDLYITHNIAEMVVKVCDPCDLEFPIDPAEFRVEEE